MVVPCESVDNIVEKPIKRCLSVLLSALFSLLPVMDAGKGREQDAEALLNICLDY